MEMLFTKETIYFAPDVFNLFAIAPSQDGLGIYSFCDYLT